jgi:hypothetical protein
MTMIRLPDSDPGVLVPRGSTSEGPTCRAFAGAISDRPPPRFVIQNESYSVRVEFG